MDMLSLRMIHLIVVLVCVMFFLQSAAGKVYYVRPSDGSSRSVTDCPSENCHTLQYYASRFEWSSNLESNTIIHFMSGVHTLEHVLQFVNVNNLTLVGSSQSAPFQATLVEPLSEIQCSGKSGMGFLSISSLSISNLSIANCGWAPANSPVFAMKLLYIINFTMSGVAIRNSTGYGLGGYNILGKSVISKSLFAYNGGDENQVSALVEIQFDMHVADNGIYYAGDSVSFSIESSHFLHGNNPNATAGLQITQTSSYLDYNVDISNVVLSSNKGNYGGNLGIFVLEPLYTTSSTHITVENTLSEKGRAQVGAGGDIQIKNVNPEPCSTLNRNTSTIRILNSSFVDNIARKSGGGLEVLIGGVCQRYQLELDSVTFSRNIASGHNQHKHDETEMYEALNVFGGNLALYTYEREYSSTQQFITVKNCLIEHGLAPSGGGAFISVHRGDINGQAFLTRCNKPPLFALKQPTIVQILNSNVIGNNSTKGAGGLVITLHDVCHYYQVFMHGVLFRNNAVTKQGVELGKNSARNHKGGNVRLFVSFTYTIPQILPSVQIENCTFESGSATGGAGLYMLLERPSLSANRVQGAQFSISNCNFINNTGSITGGGALIELRETPQQSWCYQIQMQSCEIHTVDILRINNCTFANNLGLVGSALAIQNDDSLSKSSYYNIEIKNTLITNNYILQSSVYYSEGVQQQHGPSIVTIGEYSTMYLYSIDATISNCIFSGNNGTALLAMATKLHVGHGVLFSNNTGIRGGGLSLVDSFIFVKPRTRIHFVKNHAKKVGGAVFVKQESLTSCFVQERIPTDITHTYPDIQFLCTNNSAADAGDDLYGGYISMSCFTYWSTGSGIAFQFVDTGEVGLSAISSDPLGTCFCDDLKPNCSKTIHDVEAYPGDSFIVSVVIVGQLNGTVPGIVHAEIKGQAAPTHTMFSLAPLQHSQRVGRNCTSLIYTVNSRNQREEVELTINNPIILASSPLNLPSIIEVTLLPCPLGFMLSGSPPKCDCAPPLNESNSFKCSIHNQSIQYPAGMWIGYFGNDTQYFQANLTPGIILHNHCPLDYCKPGFNDINLRYQSDQCAFNRSGMLCGGCQQGFSLSLGNSQCLKCSNLYLLLMIAFLVAGILLVAFLTVFNLTVADGTLGALIFYANIVQVNSSIFFPSGKTTVLTIFIAWLNLDLGIQTCFSDGLDMYVKAWLQFVFPIYVWVLVIVMIVSSRYSTIAGNLFSRKNAPKVLATLFLLSYAKLIRIAFTILSFTTIEYPDHTKQQLWLPDGNVRYLQGKHIPLFLVAILTLIVSLTFATVVLLTQCLHRLSQCWLFGWVWRIQPILDAYTGPYRDKYRFWTGLFLLLRIFLFLGYAVNILGDQTLNLLVTIITVAGVLCLKCTIKEIYRNWILDMLENLFLVNLIIASTAIWYIHSDKQKLSAIIDLSVGIAFTKFVILLFYHFVKARCQRCVSGVRNFVKARFNLPTRQELTSLVQDGECEQNSITPHSPDAQPQPRAVQHLRLTFDENNEAILVIDEEK